MKYKKRLLIFTLVFVFAFSLGVMAGPQDKIENMSFKNTEVVDVLRAIAEVADVNLITDSNVSGNITVSLKDITFEKSLDLITQTRALSYKWDENTVVVAAPERLDSIYANIKTEFVKVESADFDNIGTIVREIFPETQITADSVRRQFILKGEESRINEIKEMIESFINGEVEKAQKIHLKLLDLFKTLFMTTNPIPVKAEVNILGLNVGNMRLPMINASEEQKNRIIEVLQSLGKI